MANKKVVGPRKKNTEAPNNFQLLKFPITKISKLNWAIIGILTVGLVFRLLLTANGNFNFHIDSARDMLDVREVVVLHNWRLIGPTAGIDGLFTGPGWYYLMAIPFILSGGDPYAEVLMMDVFWVIGGYFLLLMMKKWGIFAMLSAGSLWITSNYAVLVTQYSYNPNPVILLSPVIIFVLARYLSNPNLKNAFFVGVMGAFFWNLEMAFAGFLPFIILLAILIDGKWRFILKTHFWLGVVTPFLFGLLPQFWFELRHNFYMSRSVNAYLTEQKSLHSTFNLADRSWKSWITFMEGFRGTFYNSQFLMWVGLFLAAMLMIFLLRKKNRILEPEVLSALLVVVVPFIGFCLLPLSIQLWHIEASITAMIFLIGLSVGGLSTFGKLGKIAAFGLAIIFMGYTLIKLEVPKLIDFDRPADNPTEFRNEIAAIDYAYSQANGRNFKVYVYSPGILDLPYQYNFWWYGQRKYGYLPKDFAYLPNEPDYIRFKDQYKNSVNPPDSGLIILIKEPGYAQREDLWKNSFTSFPTIKSDTIGPLRVEVKQEK